MKIELRSAAKINLSLDILSRRADGYHELASIVHTIGWWDDLEIEVATGTGADIEFSCNIAELSGADNLCVRAAKSWMAASGETFSLKIDLEKRIPSGAGLGGGSGNAAAILLALNLLSDTPLEASKLLEIGAKLGADVPLFLGGGALLMEGIGEIITPLAPLEGWVLVVKPQVSFATPAIFRVWDEAQFESRRDTPRLLDAWKPPGVEAIAYLIGNDLERAVAQFSDVPARVIALLAQCGALGAQMSGSGSACYGIFRENAEAEQAAARLKSELAKDVHSDCFEVQIAPLGTRGVEFQT